MHGSIPEGWTLCYIDSRDTEYHNTQCKNLIKNIPGYASYQELLRDGGNFGCFHGRTGSKIGAAFASNNLMQRACSNNIQQTTKLNSWSTSTTTLAVCIKNKHAVGN